MSLLRLTARIGADATGFHSTMGAVETRASKSSAFIGAQFRRAFAFFISFGGLLRIIRQMDQMIERIDDLKPRMRELGIEIDDAMIEKAKQARAQWEAVTTQIKVGMLPAFTEMLQLSAELALTFKFMAQMSALASAGGGGWDVLKTGYLTGGWGVAIRAIKGNFSNPFEAARLLESEYRSSLESLSNVQAARKPGDTTKTTVAKAIAEAIPKMSADALAKVGGFTGRAGEEIKSIQYRQLRSLERIETNTAPLKGGIS